MINFNDDAKKQMDKYLREVRTCLRDCLSVDADEVEQNIVEHIENEFQGETEPVSYNQLDSVLKKLGSPLQWVPEEEITWWKKIVLRLRTGPEDWRLAYISFGLLIMAFLIARSSFIIFVLTSFIISRAVISTVDHINQLKAQRWLIYPSLFIVYIFAAFWLLLWPTFALAGIADELEHLDSEKFPWNTGNEMSYWLIAIVLIAAGTALWWLVLAFVHKKKPKILQVVFRPFANYIKPSWTNCFLGISLLLLVLCSAVGILMIKYHGWNDLLLN